MKTSPFFCCLLVLLFSMLLPGQPAAFAQQAAAPDIAAGWYHNCLLKGDGSLFCWGYNDYGQANLPALNSGFSQVSAGWGHTCALREGGSLDCWGMSEWGQLNVTAPNSGFTQVSAGMGHSCALREGGSLACWGNNEYGQANLPDPNSGFHQVSAGYDHNCALKNDTSVACWGSNNFGQTNLPNPNSGFTQVSAGAYHNCALKSDGSLACWGWNNSGQTNIPTPNSGFTQVRAGYGHTCALRSGGSVACWGDNTYGQLNLPAPNSGFTRLSAGAYHTCAMKDNGSFTCWGWNNYGQTPAIILAPATLPQGACGAVYSQALAASGGVASPAVYTYSLLDGTLPEGVSLSAGGVLSGTPVQVGAFNFTIGAQDQTLYLGTRAYTWQVNGNATAVALTASPDPTVYGQSLAFTAIVTSSGGTPPGSVLFYDGPTMLGEGVLSGGLATFTTNAVEIGARSLRAVYPGSGSFAASTSNLLAHTVNPAGTQVTLISHANPSRPGGTVTVEALVSALAPSTAVPDGSLAFSVDGVPQPALALEDGRLTLAMLDPAPGNHIITAAYQGSARFHPSASEPLVQVVAYSVYLPAVMR